MCVFSPCLSFFLYLPSLSHTLYPSLTLCFLHSISIPCSLPLLLLYCILSHTLSTSLSLSLSLSIILPSSMFSTYPFSSTPYLIMTPILYFIASHSHLFNLPLLHLSPLTHPVPPLILNIHLSIHQSSLSSNHNPLPPLHLIPPCNSILMYYF